MYSLVAKLKLKFCNFYRTFSLICSFVQ